MTIDRRVHQQVRGRMKVGSERTNNAAVVVVLERVVVKLVMVAAVMIKVVVVVLLLGKSIRKLFGFSLRR